MIPEFEVAIVGGGPAGLSAALMLGRCRRKVVVFDDGHPRNASSRAAHGFLTRDGAPPELLRRAGVEEVERYGVTVRRAHVSDVTGSDGAFALRTADGDAVRASKLLLATGVVDRLPPIAGVADFYGRSVFHCPYCDAWEFRDRPLAAYAPGRQGAELALSLQSWSAEVVLLLDGGPPPPPRLVSALGKAGIPLREERIQSLRGSHGLLEAIVLEDGTAQACHALFFHLGYAQRSDLPQRLGVERTRKGTVRTGRFEQTNVPGVWVVGDASRDVQWIAIAAAEGARAAFAIHRALRG
ncbi:MAG TPA: NAD(P)/FAD-dependent oxidoreductase [Candidatus Polarisedimenticolaceae bacterium]|nr:NAD(P)/FAD-dependent oxidoreductase [Candidatus Polarisedimenticolaceae bacterium]